jgi:hypothetical protein
MKDKRALIVTILITAALACVPLVIYKTSYFVYFLFLSFTYIIITQGWNLVPDTQARSVLSPRIFGLGLYDRLNWIYI